MSKGFSASTIKSWFQYRCERKVRYELSTDAELAAVPVVKDVREQAWALLGTQYEKRVIDRLRRQAGVIGPAAGDDALSERLTSAFLRGQRVEVYAAQVNLRPHALPKFLEATGLYLKRNLADLLRRQDASDPGGPTQFTVIDVKATRHATAFHKTQVAFYVRVLEELLKELKVGGGGTAIDPFGEIWRIPDDGTAEGDDWQVERFALGPYLRLVDEFCRDVLPRIAATRVTPELDETFFHIYFKCEQCNFLGHCARAIAPERGPKRDVSAVPGLTHEAKRSLARLGVRSVAELSKAAGLAQQPGIGWSLSRRAPQLLARAKSLVAGAPARTEEQQTFLMPPRADTVLMLSVDHDPVDDRIAAIGYRRVQAGSATNQRIEVPRSGAAADEAEAMVVVLGALISDLTDIDRTNAACFAVDPKSPDAIYAHIFFYEPAEATNLQRAVGRHLEDPRIRGALLHLVRLFPPEEIVPEPEFRGVHHLPATAVKSVVEQLWALPIAVAYDLRQVSEVLAGFGAGPAYAPAEKFARPFSSLLSIDVIRNLRDGHRSAVPISAIEQDVAARLDALQGLISWLFAENHKATEAGAALLRLAKKPFQFHASFDPLNSVDLDVLLACELLENRAGLLEALVSLAQPAKRRRDAGRCLAGLTLKKHWAYGANRILSFHVPEVSRDAQLGPADFDLILTDDSPDLRLDQTVWQHLACRIRPPGKGWEDRRDLLQVQVSGNVFKSDVFQSLLRRTGAADWYVDHGFSDVNTARVAGFLQNLARGDVA